MMPGMMQQAPSPMKPEGEPDKNAIKMQITSLLKQAQKVAQQNGLDWNELVAEMSSSEVGAARTPPRPPRPEMMPPGMPGGLGPG